MSTKLDAIYANAGRKASREVLKRAARAANYAVDSVNPLLSEAGVNNARIAGSRPDWKGSVFGELAKIKTAAESRTADPAPLNAYKTGPATTETDLHKRTRAESGFWQKLNPGDRLPYDDYYDDLVRTRNAFDDDPEMIELERTMARWARKPRLRSHDSAIEELRDLLGRRRLRTSGRNVAMDAAIAASATTDRAVPKVVLYRRLQPTQTVEQALGTIDKQFGRLTNTCDFLCLKYVLQTLPPKSLLREMTAGQQQGVATVLARLELAA